MTGEGHTRTGPTDRARVERDGVTCTLCAEEPTTVTPAGPMCREHADRLASHYEDEQ